ncbi:MAG TPA: anthranilate phosphoribosyltransferase [Acidimicrobiales bacterium]|nr:anthranilate phosphoribosyltransferase [Acidimicrobiales bacterium]
MAGGHDLTPAEAAAALGEVFAGEATAAQVAAFIFGLRCKGESLGEMTGLVRAMLDASVPVPVAADLRERLVDTCGTGGDRHSTINISTIAALVVAGAGVPVCKHGGRAASSRAGSADLLEALGVAIELGPAGVARCIEEAGIGFCFAPTFHPAMRHAGPVRRELGVQTAFNLLGPLANPARVRRQMVGVGDPTVAERMALVLAANGAADALVVHGDDGLDELSTTGKSTVVRYRAPEDPAPVHPGPGDLEWSVVDPAALGLAPATLNDLRGGDADVNAGHALRILDGERGPMRDVVLLNAAGGLLAGGVVADLAQGIVTAEAAVDSGRARACLDRLVAVSQEAAGPD